MKDSTVDKNIIKNIKYINIIKNHSNMKMRSV